MSEPVVTTFLTPSARRLALGFGASELAYLEGAPAAGARHLSLEGRPEQYLPSQRLAYEWAERLAGDSSLRESVKPVLDSLCVPEPHLSLALRKTLSALLENDARAHHLASIDLGVPRIHLSANAPLLRRLGLAGVEFVTIPDGILARAANAAFWGSLALGILRPSFARPSAPVAWLLDQYYATMDDQEFLSFDRYFKTRSDFFYIVPPGGSPKRRYLAEIGRPHAAHRWSVPFARKGRESRRLARLAFALTAAQDIPSTLARGLLRLARTRLRFMSLLDVHPARRVLRVRFDMDPTHPVAAAVCAERGSKLIGYMCGSYTYFSQSYAPLDFDEYGLLGRAFRTTLPWPDSARYALIGPFTVELDDVAPPPAGRIAGVFPTSFGPGFFMQQGFYRDFLEACAKALAGTGLEALIKGKDYEPSAHAELRRCFGEITHRIVYNHPCEGRPAQRAPQVIAASGICLVMGCSTVAWEALALRRKLVIYEQDFMPHPFEKIEPRLIARTPAQLKARVAEFLEMSQPDYERMITPVLETWGRASDGSLVRNFVESLEHGS